MQILPFLRRSCNSQDWTNDELAQLYRVENSLIQLNIALETERGQTDEGDPWFVFCRTEGEVLVHFARFDGLYHLHAPAVPLNLTGHSFEQLARRFVDVYPVNVPAKPDPKIVLHPSAIFTILIAAAVFASDHGAQAATPDDESNSHSRVLAKHGGLDATELAPIARGDKQAESVAHVHLSAYFNAVAAAAAIVFNVIPHDLVNAPAQFQIHSQSVSDLIDITSIEESHPALSGFRIAASEHQDHLASVEPSQASDAWSHISDAVMIPVISHNISATEYTSPIDDAAYFSVQRPTLHNDGWDGSEPHVWNESALLQHAYFGAAIARGSGASHSSVASSAQTERPASAPAESEAGRSADDVAGASTANAPTDISHAANALETWNQVLGLIATRTHSASTPDETDASGAIASLTLAATAPLTAADQTHYTAAVALTIKNFILSFDSAKAVVRDGNIFVFDGLTADQDSSALTTKTWELDNGNTISIVGHADHPIHYELVA